MTRGELIEMASRRTPRPNDAEIECAVDIGDGLFVYGSNRAADHLLNLIRRARSPAGGTHGKGGEHG